MKMKMIGAPKMKEGTKAIFVSMCLFPNHQDSSSVSLILSNILIYQALSAVDWEFSNISPSEMNGSNSRLEQIIPIKVGAMDAIQPTMIHRSPRAIIGSMYSS